MNLLMWISKKCIHLLLLSVTAIGFMIFVFWQFPQLGLWLEHLGQ